MFPKLSTMEINGNFTLTEEANEFESLFDHDTVRQWPEGFGAVSLASMEVTNTSSEPDLPIGVVIPTLDAVDWSNGYRNVDVRPRLIDKSTNQARLVDTGAQITATVRLPGDKEDDSRSYL